jgi:hypothetical protein
MIEAGGGMDVVALSDSIVGLVVGMFGGEVGCIIRWQLD